MRFVMVLAALAAVAALAAPIAGASGWRHLSSAQVAAMVGLRGDSEAEAIIERAYHCSSPPQPGARAGTLTYWRHPGATSVARSLGITGRNRLRNAEMRLATLGPGCTVPSGRSGQFTAGS
jgi:hypothetical protein